MGLQVIRTDARHGDAVVVTKPNHCVALSIGGDERSQLVERVNVAEVVELDGVGLGIEVVGRLRAHARMEDESIVPGPAAMTDACPAAAQCDGRIVDFRARSVLLEYEAVAVADPARDVDRDCIRVVPSLTVMTSVPALSNRLSRRSWNMSASRSYRLPVIRRLRREFCMAPGRAMTIDLQRAGRTANVTVLVEVPPEVEA